MAFSEFLEDAYETLTERAPAYPDQRLQSPLKGDIGQLAYRCVTKSLSPVPVWIARTVARMQEDLKEDFSDVRNYCWSDISGDIYRMALLPHDEERFVTRLQRGLRLGSVVTDIFSTELRNKPFVFGYDQLWLSTKRLFESRMRAYVIRNCMMRTSRNRDVRPIKRTFHRWEFTLSRELCLVRDSEQHFSFFCDYQAILLMCDVIDQRFLCNLGFQLFGVAMPEIYTVTEDDLLELYAWGDCLLIDKKNEAYNILKFFEPLCMACLLEKTDTCGLSETFVKGNRRSYQEAGGSLSSLQRLLAVLSKFGPPMLSEIFGLYRMWGHPIVDEVAGCLKVQTVGKRTIQMDHETLRLIYAGYYQTR